MPYKRAWMLINSLSLAFGRPVVEATSGGKGGGGTRLTHLGEQLIASYDALEKRLNLEAVDELQALQSLAK